MLRHYFPRGYANRAAGIIEAFSLLHGQKRFRLDFSEAPMGAAIANAYTDVDSIAPYAASSAATLISCGMHPAPPFAFLFKDKTILKEPAPFLAHLLAGSRSITMLSTRVYSYPQPLLAPVSSLIETADPGPLSDAELFRQQKSIKELHEVIYSDELETYLEKQKYAIIGLLEEKGIRADWA